MMVIAELNLAFVEKMVCFFDKCETNSKTKTSSEGNFIFTI